MTKASATAPGQNTGSPVRRNLLRSGAALIGLAAASLLVIQGSGAAFTATTGNTANALSAGTVVLSDNDSNVKMFDYSALNGGQSVARCINVTYSGTLAADIKLHGVATGALANGLAMTVEEGSGSTSTACAGFTAASTLYTGTLANFSSTKNSYANGVAGFTALGGVSTTKSYRITMTVSNDSSYQGTSASADFVWEAQGIDAS